MPNGVTLALDYVRERADGMTKSPYCVIAMLLSNEGATISENAIYNFEKKGFFPPERAKVIAHHYGLAYEDLVSPAVRAILANS